MTERLWISSGGGIRCKKHLYREMREELGRNPNSIVLVGLAGSWIRLWESEIKAIEEGLGHPIGCNTCATPNA